jgi:hypothetical protein
MNICGRMAMASPAGDSMTTARLRIDSSVRMPTSGVLMIGAVMMEPVQPVLSSVKVPPWMSSSLSRPPRARSARSRIHG